MKRSTKVVPVSAKFGAPDADLREKSDAMLVVFKLFVALCAEVRLGWLVAGDLQGRISRISAGGLAKSKGESATGHPPGHVRLKLE